MVILKIQCFYEGSDLFGPHIIQTFVISGNDYRREEEDRLQGWCEIMLLWDLVKTLDRDGGKGASRKYYFRAAGLEPP
jgi:hypothetical protein